MFVKCPKCGSVNCSISSETKTTGKDYSVAGGLLGELIFGPSGFVCGMSNSRTMDVQAFWICKNCGNKFTSY